MSAFSISEPFPTFSDRNGQPLEAGYLYFGVAGLDPVTNPVTVYWDAALTIPAAQPVRTLNGYPSNNGTASRLYVNAGDFSTSVRDSKNTLVFTALNSTLRIPASSITGQFDASQVDYTQGDTNSQTRTVESKLQDTVSVFDFMTPAEIAGVKAGTFLVDVTTAVRNAVSSPARDIYFPQGGYLVGDNSGDPAIWIDTVTTSKTLRGAGRQATVIRNAGIGVAIGSTGGGIVSNTSIRIADMSVEGSIGTNAGILFDYTSQSVIERVDCYGHGSAGIRILNGAHVSVVDAWCRSNTGVALEIGDNSFFIDVRGGTFESSASGAFIAPSSGTAPRYITFTGSSFRGNVNSNVDVGQAADVRFFGCSFQASGGTTTRHLSVDGGAGLASGVVLDGCSLVGVNTALTTRGIFATKCEDLSVMNCVIDCTGATAYDVTATAVRTRFYDNAVILGTQTNASPSTVRRTFVAPTESRSFFGDGPWQLDFTGNTNAFRFRQSAVASVDSIFEYDGWRTWVDDTNANLMLKGTDPATPTDGFSVGPGLLSYTVATLPAGAPVGYMAKVTDGRTFPAQTWGDVIVGLGGTARFVIHTGGGVWTIIGNA